MVDLVDSAVLNRKIFIVGQGLSQEDLDLIKERISFYIPDFPLQNLVYTQNMPWHVAADKEIVLLFGKQSDRTRFFRQLGRACFNIDWNINPSDGWEWIYVANQHYQISADIPRSKLVFSEYVAELRKQNYRKCYIFGTGPSLDRSRMMDWSDGYRIVCNTIVRDKELWHHIKPHFIVAGDAIYHFGHTLFAKTFRADLISRLQETATYFIYPSIFDNIVRREMSHLSTRLIPIPIGRHQKIDIDLFSQFELPAVGNVLPLLLLPVGCTLSTNIHLWGFDGRKPQDRLFWSNSDKHSYSDLLVHLQEAHPMFFKFHVPDNNPFKYVESVHGDVLEQMLCSAESNGYHFTMMHPSFTPNLQKRFIPVAV